MRPWHERPGALQREFDAFAAAGYEYTVVQGPPKSEDVILGVRATVDGQHFDLTVNYPDSYPFLRPHVMLEGDVLDRHQNPVEKNLCLLDRSTRAWTVDMTAASHIAEQLPKLLAVLEMDPEERAELEAPQGEPLSAFLRYLAGAVVLIPNLQAETGTATHGQGRIRLFENAPSPEVGALRGVLATLTTPNEGKHPKVLSLGRANDELLRRTDSRSVGFHWVRIDLRAQDIAGDSSAERLRDLAQGANPDAALLQYEKVGDAQIAVLGILFTEEVELNEHGDVWTFVVSVRPNAGGEAVYLVRGERASVEDLLARTPTVSGLRSKTVALVGLGALGSPAAMEFARLQVGTLRVLDFDTIEYGTTVRWWTGLDAVMHLKPFFVKAVAETNYPYVNVEGFEQQLGVPVGRGEKPEREVLRDLFAGADVIVDLSAEPGVNYLLSRLADERNLPQVYGWGTEGGWGGGVARAIPGKTGCWLCLQWHLEDKSIETPPRDATGMAQPRGCASRTYTGTNFDLLPIVAQTVRLATQTLLREEADAYPDGAADVMILALRDSDGAPITPRWTEYPLTPHPNCWYCQRESS